MPYFPLRDSRRAVQTNIRLDRRNRRATTLVEVLIASTIALTVTGLASLLLLSYAKLAEGTMLQERINGEAQRAMKLLDLQVKSAVSLTTEERGTVIVLEQPDGKQPRWTIDGGQLVYSADSGRGRPETSVVMMNGIADSSRLQLQDADGFGGRQMVDVQLHLVDEGGSDGLQVLTLNTRLAARVDAVGIEGFRMATARAASLGHVGPAGSTVQLDGSSE